MEQIEEIRTALSTFNAVFKNIESRSEKIENNKLKMKELKPHVDEFAALEIENKELKKENDKERAYVSSTIEFYEKQSGDTVGVGDLFEKQNEG